MTDLIRESCLCTDGLCDGCNAVIARLAEAEAALRDIIALDPEHDSDEGFNEWGEAHCFKKAQDIARRAVNEGASRE